MLNPDSILSQAPTLYPGMFIQHIIILFFFSLTLPLFLLSPPLFLLLPPCHPLNSIHITPITLQHSNETDIDYRIRKYNKHENIVKHYVHIISDNIQPYVYHTYLIKLIYICIK
jgi:hypothetical protein